MKLKCAMFLVVQGSSKKVQAMSHKLQIREDLETYLDVLQQTISSPNITNDRFFHIICHSFHKYLG